MDRQELCELTVLAIENMESCEGGTYRYEVEKFRNRKESVLFRLYKYGEMISQFYINLGRNTIQMYDYFYLESETIEDIAQNELGFIAYEVWELKYYDIS